MKKLFYAFAALAVVASCAKVAEVENTIEPKDENNLVHMTIRAQSPETKTYIEKTGEKTYQPQWNSTDKLGVFFDSVKATKDAELENTSADGAKAEFYGPVSVEKGTYRIYAYSPSDATISKESDTKVVFTVPSVQYPSADNFDSAADIVVSKADDITIAGSDVIVDNMVFGRILSSVKVTINNNNASVDNSEKINAVIISADDSNLTGTLGWDFENSEADIVSGNSSVTAILTANPLDFGTSFFLLLNPTTVTASALKPLTITIYTDSHKITKTITSLAKDLVFPLAGIAELKISTSGADVTDVYAASLVKSPSTLLIGDEVVITAADLAFDAALSTDQKTNNRGAINELTFFGDVLFVDNADIQRFEIESGLEDNTFAFKCINGGEADHYIFAASSTSNYLRSQDSIDGNASFTVAFNGTGVAEIEAQGSNTRNILKFNSTNNLFSCYSSGQQNVAIYRYKNGIPSLSKPVNLDADYDAGSVDVIWDAVPGADSYTVTMTGKLTQSGITTTATTFTEVTPGVYTITVTAISNDHSTKLDSAPASITLPLGNPALAKPVISSFTENATGFSAEISAAVEYATSYDWDLFEGDMETLVGSGNTISLSFDIAFTSDDMDIDAFKASETYYLVITAKAAGFTSTASDASNFVAAGIETKVYTLTISTSDFLSTSYAANNNEKTSNAIASDDTPLSVKWTSYQVMLQSGVMQWQKNNGYIYNSTNLGKIISVTVNSTDGTFTTYYGTSEQPSSSTTLGVKDGFFKIKVGNATGKTSSVVVKFEK